MVVPKVPLRHRSAGVPEIPRFRTVAATLAGLWGFAFVDPVFGLLGNSPPFFTAHGVGGWQVLLWAIVTASVPPLICAAGLRLLAKARERAAACAYLVLVALLFAMIVVPRVDNGWRLPVVGFGLASAAIALAFGLAYMTGPVVRRVSAATWFSPALFTALFLFASPASGLVLPAQSSEAVELARPTDVLMIVLDEFPVAALLDDRSEIDRERFPGFARLADLSTWYRDTTTPSVRTEHAVSALLTGREPATASGQPPDLDLLQRNLFAMLSGTHSLNTIEPMLRLCDFAGCTQLGRSANVGLYRNTGFAALRHWLPRAWAEERFRFLEGNWNFADDQSGEQVIGLRDLLARASNPSPDPAAWFGHFFLPHRPWEWLPGGYRYPAGTDRPPGSQPGDGHSYWSDDDRVVDLMRQRLLLQVQALDEIIGELVDALEQGAISRDAMVVVTADHGISFEQGEIARGWELAPEQHADIARVPLFIRYPGQASGEIDDRPASLLDVLPTALDVLGAALPGSWDLDGRPLTGQPEGPRERAIFDDARRIPLDGTLDMSAAVAQYRSLGPDPANLFAFGPPGSLVGQPWSALSLGRSHESGRLVDRHLYESVEPASLTPAMVEVELPGPVTEPWAVVAVNDLVAGSGPVYQYEGVWRIAAMVDPRSFTPGSNEVKIALGSPGAALTPLRLT